MLRFPHALGLLHDKKFDTRHALYLFCLVILFWALFDATVAYLVPITITERGISNTLMGVIVGTSSIAGAFFDFLLCRFLGNTYYKRLFIWMFAVCLFVPFVLFQAHTFWMFILAMVLWGIYYDFKGIGIFNFVGRNTSFEKHAESFGLIQIFLSLGYLIAPLFVGFLVAERFDWRPFALAWVFISISIFFFIALVLLSRQLEDTSQAMKEHGERKQEKFSTEIRLWRGIGKVLFPVLFFTFLVTVADAYFWTIGPLIAEELVDSLGVFSGAFMVAYVLPPLLVAFFVGRYTKKFGKKYGAIISFFLGSCLLLLFPCFGTTPWLVVGVFFASMGISLSLPAVNGAYADYISETEEYEKEIEGLQDFYTNLGFVFGPMSAGYLSDVVGNLEAFVYLGLFCGIAVVILTLFMPKSINVRKQMTKA